MNGQPGASHTTQLVEHLFRRQSARLIAALTAMVGLAQIDSVEDVVQETLLRALKSWPHAGIPENPEAWLHRTARNLMIDQTRSAKLHATREADITRHIESESMAALLEPTYQHEFDDNQLRMIFACCHPSLPDDAQTAIALKELCGFSVGEIARAFLAEESTIAQRIVRGKKQFRSGAIPFEMPEPSEMMTRMDAALRVIYLIFNEGYTRHSGNDLISKDLAEDAIRLAELLAANPITNTPELHALLALFYFQISRFPSRQSGGDLILLEYQDRTLWDRQSVARGFHHLEKAATGNKLSRYHFEAGIASLHAQALSFEKTDWRQMVEWYDQLLELEPSPIVFLNRAVALGFWKGFEVGLTVLDSSDVAKSLLKYPYFHAVRAEMLIRLRRPAEAIAPLQTAISLTQNSTERAYLSRKLALLTQS